MAIVGTLAPTTFANGATPSLTHSNPLPSGVSSFLFRYQQDTSTGLWLFDGASVIDAILLYAPDGVTFSPIKEYIIVDEVFIAHGTIPAGEGRWSIDIPDVGSQTRKVKLNTTFSRHLRIGGTLEVN